IVFLTVFGASVLIAFGSDLLFNTLAASRIRRISAYVIVLSVLVLSIYTILQVVHYRSLIASAHVGAFVRALLTRAFVLLMLGAICVLVVLITRRQRVRHVIGAILCVLTLVDLFGLNMTYNPAISRNLLYPVTPEIDFLQHQTGMFRVSAIGKD